MSPEVVVVGSFVQDLCFRCAAFPSSGQTTLGKFIPGPGGKGSNQAVAAARAGAATRFIGAVGDDVFAAGARTFHRTEGIDTHLVARPPHATATAAILVDAAGHNQIVVALGASAHLRPRDVSPALLRGARVVVCQHEANLAINAHVFRAARRADATTVLNPAPMRADFDPAILRLVDVLIPNESECVALARHFDPTSPLTEAALAGLPPDDLQRLCRRFAVPLVIVTLGARGCFVSRADGGELIAGHKVKAVDTTGAGDAFVGAFAAGLVRFSGDVSTAARFANAAAALAVTKPGTAPAMPRRAAIDRQLRREARR